MKYARLLVHTSPKTDGKESEVYYNTCLSIIVAVQRFSHKGITSGGNALKDKSQ